MIQIDLTGQVAVVTGGSSGIGLATAELFLRAGASVAICGRDAERLAQAEASLIAQFPAAQLLAAKCDVLDAEDVNAFAQAVQSRFGRTDMLVNNAGQGRVSTFADTTDDAWREELDLKYFSVMRPTRAFLPMLRGAAGNTAGSTTGSKGKGNGNAAIVCVNSLLALQPEAHMVATSSARAGVLSLTKSLAVELAPHRVRVNSILIGIVESGQWRRRFETQAAPGQSWEDWTGELARKKNIPLGRFGRPEEAAQALFYLATNLSSYTTGSHIDVSGGNARHV
jgi:NAD(P)-dependent dehydrogenase (short-subunit alcohol dehydrogenase family)